MGDLVVSTPALALPTNLYSLHFLTRDMFDLVLDPQRTILEVYYEDILENWSVLKQLPMSFKKFANLEGYPLWLALKEERYFVNSEGLKHANSDKAVSCVNHGGVVKLSMESIKEISNVIKPEASIAPVDHFVLPGNDKRRRTAADKASKYWSQLKDIPNMLPSFVSSTERYNDGINVISAVDVQAIDKLASHDGVSALYLRSSSSTFDLTISLQLMLKGKQDILDGTSILKMSEKGFALQLPSGAFDAETVKIEWIDLNDRKYERDSSVLCEGCACPGCQFMKCYLHHLFVVHEILGSSAVTAHNIHQTIHLLSQIK